MKKVLFAVFTALGLLQIYAPALQADRTIVSLETNYGDIIIELYDDQAPITVNNFLEYVNSGFYDGLIFHRVINDFMIQAGAYDPNLYNADFGDNFNIEDPCFYHTPNAPIQDELDTGLENDRGTIAMANAGANTATSQFFINQKAEGNHHLDGKHAVFGLVSRGMDVVDDIAQQDVFSDANITQYFEALPKTPVIIEKASVLRRFDPCSAYFQDLDFLKAADGTIRTFAGQGDLSDSSFRQEFQQIEFLGIQCLEWKQIAQVQNDNETIDNITAVIARDTDGNNWLLKYIINEDAENEVKLVEAGSLIEAVSFEEFADQEMQFRLMEGLYDEDNPDSDQNTIVTGAGLGQVTQQITDFHARLDAFPGTDLIKVKWTRGPAGAVTQTKWLYYDRDKGLVLELRNEAGDTDGDGWRLAEMNFDEHSNDFSDTAYLMVPTGTDLTRTYKGLGAYEGLEYTQKFSFPSDTFQGVKYMQWKQEIVGSHGIDNFTLDLARDVDGNIWVFKYILNTAVIYEPATLLEAVPFSTINDNMLFRLINGLFNAEDIDDTENSFTLGSGENIQTFRIDSFQASAYTPFFQGELVSVADWIGSDPCDSDINKSWYHSSVGLVVNLQNGTSGPSGDGWIIEDTELFDETSDDFSDVPFLKVPTPLPDDGSSYTRSFLGQGAYDPCSFEHKFRKSTIAQVACMRWEQTGVPEADITPFYIHLAKDKTGRIWSFGYYVNDEPVQEVALTQHDAVPLSQLAEDNMYFRLIAHTYDADNLDDPCNTITVSGTDNIARTEKIFSFAGKMDQPAMAKDITVVRQTSSDPDKPFIEWDYYHKDVGLLLVVSHTSETAGESNFFDPNDTASMVMDLDGWRLGWYGREQPSFDPNEGLPDFDSADFSSVPYLQAAPGDLRLYRGQGDFQNYAYQSVFSAASLLDINCLKISESAVTQANKPEITKWLARDITGGLWVCKITRDNTSVFTAPSADQIIPFDLYPEIPFRLMSGEDNFAVGTTVTTGEGDTRQTEAIVSLSESLSGFADYDNELALVSFADGADDTALDWSYYHSSTGLVLDLWDNALDPCNIDTGSKGWKLQQNPTNLSNVKFSLTADSNREQPLDKFTLTGDINVEAEDLQNSQVFFKIGPYYQTFRTDDPGAVWLSRKKVLIFSGKLNGQQKITCKIDANKNKFWLSAKKVVLSGITKPLTARLAVGTVDATGTATLKGRKELPVKLARGEYNELRKGNFVYQKDDYHSNTLSLHGRITTARYPLDLTQATITIGWGSSTFTIDSGKMTANKAGTKFTYHNSTGLRKAVFDLKNCRYKLFIKQPVIKQPPQTLEIKIEIDDETVFDEKVTIS